jgi:DNA modification methylase
VDVSVLVLCGDARALPLPDASVDAIVCDPPYGLEFMGHEWDSFKPGGKRPTIGAADGTPYRRNAGTPSWAGSGNPVCLNCGGTKYDRTRPNGCACDRPTFPNESGAHMRAFQAWCERWAAEANRVLKPGGHLLAFGGTRTWHRLTVAIEDAGFEIRDSIGHGHMAWIHGQGFPKGSSQLKPAWEPIAMARKPLAGTVASNVLAHGTGGINVDGCRIDANGEHFGGGAYASSGYSGIAGYEGGFVSSGTGRWPTNVVLSHAPLLDEPGEVVGDACADGCVPGCPVAELDAQSGVSKDGVAVNRNRQPVSGSWYGTRTVQTGVDAGYGGEGGASRFFPTFRYEAKAPDHERPRVNGIAHPTVKPLDLIRWLCRLVTPPAGLVLDMFAGSGTTGEAALMEGLGVVLVEREADHLPLIRYRIDRARRRLQPGMARLGRTALPKPVDGQEALDLFA